jgi:saccharopine dehydrogenase-like NADP-dependent oxidoreductase
MRITVLGAGLVGSAIVKDLAQEKDFSVTAVDMNQQALEKLASQAPVQVVLADVRQQGRVAALARACDLMVCAVPGFLGFATLKQIIEAGRNVVDISFFAEDALLLDGLARQHGVTAVVDCGVAPGLCNIQAGRVAALLDECTSYSCYVGGLPKVRQWPYEYKAVFSPRDVIEEYTRPARLVEHGQEVVRPALSELEPLDFAGVGTLEAFNTDGVRTLRQTLPMPFMKEKTLRYPGHVNLMRVLRESGFFNPTPIVVDGQPVSPLAVTSKLLFDQWLLKPGEEDITVMQVVVEGRKGDRRLRYTYDLHDEYDRATQTHSMARTTGYTCAIVARQVAHGLFTRKGICPPEYIGAVDACYADLMAGYAARNIRVVESVREV